LVVVTVAESECARTRSRYWSVAAGIAHESPIPGSYRPQVRTEPARQVIGSKGKEVKIVRTIEKQAGILYNSATGMMVMEFADRGRYIYHDVPKSIYEVLKCAPAHVHAQFVNNAGHNYSITDGVETY
jgi:hypothetical protein